MSNASQPEASFGTTKRKIAGVIFRAQAMHDGIGGDPGTFVSPPVTLAAFLALITALVLAQQTAQDTKAKGAATVRNVKRDLLWAAMESLRAYVMGLTATMSVEQAIATIKEAGLLVSDVPAHPHVPLTASPTSQAGVVRLVASILLLAGKAARGKKHQVNWQWSADGKVWNDAHPTPYATTEITGLTAMTTYFFRASVTVGTVTGAWSQPVSLLVLH
jgi:hypothetical protein